MMRKLLLVVFVLLEVNSENRIKREIKFVSTTELPSSPSDLADRVLRLELQAELSGTIRDLNNAITLLQKTKENIIEDIEKAVESKLKNYETKLNIQLTKIRDEIITELEKKGTNKLNLDACVDLPTDCKDVQMRGQQKSGKYRIKPENAFQDFEVWCDMTTQGGGWTYVLNRYDGSQNFFLLWEDYKTGFGNLHQEFWLGLEKLYLLTNSKSNELLFEMSDWDGKVVYAKYTTFVIGSESEGYNLKTLEGFSGDVGDSFSLHKGMKFSTVDRDQDAKPASNCADYNKGGWWYKDCFFCHPTGRYIHKGPLLNHESEKGIHWYGFRKYDYSLKSIKMMIRPKDKIRMFV